VVGAEFNFLVFFSHNSKKRLVFGSSGRIRIQMIKFEFKCINQKPPSHYHPPAPAAGGSVSGSTRRSSSVSTTAHSRQVNATVRH
jgi:hypothetical protein